ncbi:RNA polymerase sigma-70 factor [Amycolatopsis taiwanensis]|uniref:RNA polymerase sigma-70 factor n=1 Tax=Amycolatopsis taiwanensis TaxID=342230 RepID=UPI000485F377|nr:RNA polymerase sigma-70 factor [Amycolatopsis taiwanensis]
MTDPDVQGYQQLRPLLFSIAYKTTGSVGDAEDIVSEAFLRFHRARAEGKTVKSLKSYLSMVVTRLSIDHLRSARVRRERYFGTWLPEPMVGEESEAGLSDSLSLAFLVVLERLSPVERAVFLLHDVFDFDYPRIAEIVGKSEVNCRQIASRARRYVNEKRPRFEVSPDQRTALAERFFAAVETGDFEGLVELLAADVVTYGDGGGRGPSLPKPVAGRDRVLRLLAALTAAIRRFDLHLVRATVNGQPGALVRDASGALLNVLSVDILGGRVRAVHSILNPDKLGHLAPLIGPDHPLRRSRSTR